MPPVRLQRGFLRKTKGKPKHAWNGCQRKLKTLEDIETLQSTLLKSAPKKSSIGDIESLENQQGKTTTLKQMEVTRRNTNVNVGTAKDL